MSDVLRKLRILGSHGLPEYTLEDLRTIFTLAYRWHVEPLEEEVVHEIAVRFPTESNIAFYESLEEDNRYRSYELHKHYLLLIKRVEPLLPAEEQQLDSEAVSRIARLRRLARGHLEHFNVPWEREQVSGEVNVGDDVIESLIDDMLDGTLETSPFCLGINILETDLDEIKLAFPSRFIDSSFFERWKKVRASLLV